MTPQEMLIMVSMGNIIVIILVISKGAQIGLVPIGIEWSNLLEQGCQSLLPKHIIVILVKLVGSMEYIQKWKKEL